MHFYNKRSQVEICFYNCSYNNKKYSDGNYEVGGKNIFQFFCKFREGTQIFCERMCLNKKLK